MKDSSDLPELQTKPHVQIYAIMNEHREYDLVDQGELEVITDEGEETMMHYLEVQAGGNTLMRSRLRLENNYEKQKGSVICWTDNEQPEFEDLAVSFQSDEECDFYW